MRRGSRGLPGWPDSHGRTPTARRPDHRDQRRRHDVCSARTGKTSLFKWANPASFLFILSFFKQTIKILQQINVKKCHVDPAYGAGFQIHDLLNMSHVP